MKLLKIVAAGALSYFAYRTWKRTHDEADAQDPHHTMTLPDDGARTAPHGDPILSASATDASTAPRASSHTGAGLGSQH